MYIIAELKTWQPCCWFKCYYTAISSCKWHLLITPYSVSVNSLYVQCIPTLSLSSTLHHLLYILTFPRLIVESDIVQLGIFFVLFFVLFFPVCRSFTVTAATYRRIEVPVSSGLSAVVGISPSTLLLFRWTPPSPRLGELWNSSL